MPRSIGGYLVELLAANDIDTVFGIPGVHNLELYRGLTAASMRIAGDGLPPQISTTDLRSA